jgi:hypothetical protein
MSDARQRNIDEINSSGSGYDVVIVCTGTQRQADFWQARLESGKGVLLPATSSVVAVHEDWPGGAGNGLGTFYAYLKACAAAKERFDMVRQSLHTTLRQPVPAQWRHADGTWIAGTAPRITAPCSADHAARARACAGFAGTPGGRHALDRALPHSWQRHPPGSSARCGEQQQARRQATGLD